MYYDQNESGARIAGLRKERGLTQEQLAEQMNISTSYLGKIERGIQAPSIPLLVDLAGFLQTTTDFLLIGSVPEQKKPEELIDVMILQLRQLKKQL